MSLNHVRYDNDRAPQVNTKVTHMTQQNKVHMQFSTELKK